MDTTINLQLLAQCVDFQAARLQMEYENFEAIIEEIYIFRDKLAKSHIIRNMHEFQRELSEILLRIRKYLLQDSVVYSQLKMCALSLEVKYKGPRSDRQDFKDFSEFAYNLICGIFHLSELGFDDSVQGRYFGDDIYDEDGNLLEADCNIDFQNDDEDFPPLEDSEPLSGGDSYQV